MLLFYYIPTQRNRSILDALLTQKPKITMKNLEKVTISFSWIILSWCSFFRIFISCIAVIGKCRNIKLFINKEDAIRRSLVKLCFQMVVSQISNAYPFSLIVHSNCFQRHYFSSTCFFCHVNLPIIHKNTKI